jgi:4-amino-4-deoxy-L-arabinose transferase-like glycosyltransferase
LLGGVFLGLAVLVRIPAILILPYLLIYFLVKKNSWQMKLQNAALLGGAFFVTISPWLIRNYIVLGKPVLSSGGNRLLLCTLSDEFISQFPKVSIDKIEYEFFNKNADSLAYMKNLSELEIDKEFARLTLIKMKKSPQSLINSLAAKLKIFIPINYYPLRNNYLKNIIYSSFYRVVYILFIIQLAVIRNKKENVILYLAILGIATQAVFFFMLSRHLYPVICLMITAIFSQLPELADKFKRKT